WAEGFPGLDVWAPTFASEENHPAFARFMRMAASPTTAVGLLRMFWNIDVRPILPAIHVPTLILHRRGERAIGVSHARYLVEHIASAKYVEMPGVDHLLFAGDHEAIATAVEEFFKAGRFARRPDRLLATVLVTAIADSTRQAAELGERRWRDLV